jgi:hypothetical protein
MGFQGSWRRWRRGPSGCSLSTGRRSSSGCGSRGGDQGCVDPGLLLGLVTAGRILILGSSPGVDSSGGDFGGGVGVLDRCAGTGRS